MIALRFLWLALKWLGGFIALGVAIALGLVGSVVALVLLLTVAPFFSRQHEPEF